MNVYSEAMGYSLSNVRVIWIYVEFSYLNDLTYENQLFTGKVPNETHR